MQAEGDISEQARQQARQLACDADIRIKAPQGVLPPISNKPNPTLTIFRDFAKPQETRLPMTGQLVRHYQGRDIVVEVEGNKFRFEDKVYKSLSAIAKEVTGTHWNGFTFFGLSGKQRTKKEINQ